METIMNTKHATIRSQQRGIPPLIQSWLLAYGEENYDGRGTLIRYFTNKSVRKMEREFGREPIRRMSEFLRCYLVEGENGDIITVGKRYANTRINHH
jgi:hypothetical protein